MKIGAAYLAILCPHKAAPARPASLHDGAVEPAGNEGIDLALSALAFRFVQWVEWLAARAHR